MIIAPEEIKIYTCIREQKSSYSDESRTDAAAWRPITEFSKFLRTNPDLIEKMPVFHPRMMQSM